MEKFDENIFYKRLKNKKGHKTAQQNAAKIIGFSKYYNFKHTPHPMRKSTFKKFFDRNPPFLKKTSNIDLGMQANLHHKV